MNNNATYVPPYLHAALREIFAWGPCYPLRHDAMIELTGMGLVRRMFGLAWLGLDYWDITEEGKAWVRGQDG